MKLTHHYDVRVTWEGNRGTGTSHYREYGRETRVEAAGKPECLRHEWGGAGNAVLQRK